MVSCISKGRYGNFCFANMTAYAYSLKYGLDFHIQDKTLAPHMWPLYHQHLKNPNWNPSLPSVYVNDDGHRYMELPFEESWRDKNIIIGTPDINTGYFQSYKYLEGYEDRIRYAFRLNNRIRSKHVGIHWRFGDYRNYPTRHPIVPDRYMLDAINVIKNTFPESKYYDFYSDEIECCISFVDKYFNDKKSFSFSARTTTLGYAEKAVELDFDDLVSAEHLIVSNSSFSILAAILNSNSSKMVVCPHEDNYMGIENKHLDVTDLYPPNWVRIKY